jgi:tRNA (guanosine-2'-O-)-methyltransferase
MDELLKKNYLEFLLEFVTQHKRSRFEEVVRYRTRHLTIVLENIYQSHNASAVLRSCDCFGIQDVHIIENENQFTVNPDVELGSSQWLTLFRYNEKAADTAGCLAHLKAAGYRIVATSPWKNDYMLSELPMEQKTALLFGTELNGLSQTALEMADCSVRIPMVGFTESFNISVSAAICLYDLTTRLHRSDIEWRLSDSEQIDILIQWAGNVVKHPSMFEKEFMRSRMGK